MNETKTEKNDGTDQIRQNKRLIFELEASVTDNYARAMLALADVEENRALLLRNFTASFMGNRSLARDNEEDLYRNRLLMIESLQADDETQEDFKGELINATRLDQLEYRMALNEALSKITENLTSVNATLGQINALIMEANENVVINVDDMISENAAWIDGKLEQMKNAARPKANSSTAQSNRARGEKLMDAAHAHGEKIAELLQKVESETTEILDTGVEIANRKARIMAAREKVSANQKRAADFLVEKKK